MDFDLIEKAGFTNEDFAFICDISPVMVWKYRRGAAPRVKTAIRVNSALTVLSLLIDKGQLPHPEAIKGTGRGHGPTLEKTEFRKKLVRKVKEIVENRLAN